MALQTDGKLLIGGDFAMVRGVPRTGIARLNADGTPDSTFDPGTGIPATLTSRRVRVIAVQPDGRILIGGSFTNVDGTVRNRIARLHSNGSLDYSFDPGTGASGSVTAIALQANGQMLIAGFFSTFNAINRSYIVRLNADGTLDNTFNVRPSDAVRSVVLLPDGKAVIGGWFGSVNGTNCNRVARLHADGSLDTAFDSGAGPNGNVDFVALSSGGKVIVGGNFTNFSGAIRYNVARLNADGSLDHSFTPPVWNTPFLQSSAFAVQADDKVIMEWTLGGACGSRLSRLNADGILDTTFMSLGGCGPTYSLVVQPDGKLLVGGEYSYNEARLGRWGADGTLDGTFRHTAANRAVTSLAYQNGGKVLLGSSFGVARVSADGNLDVSFDRGGYEVNSVVSQPDGKVIVGGTFDSFGDVQRRKVARLYADGTLDSGFDPGTSANGSVRSVVLQPDGKVLIGGYALDATNFLNSGIVRVNSDGTLDTSFHLANAITGAVSSIALQPDAGMIVGGNFTTSAGNRGCARLHYDGSLDANFSPSIGTNSSVYSVVVQPDGKVLIGGNFSTVNSSARRGLARLNPSGTLDTGFFTPPSGVTGGPVHSIALEQDGKILIGGAFTNVNGFSRSGIARLEADGTLDTNFNTTAGAVYSVVVQPDGKVLIGGDFRTVNGIVRWHVARLMGDPPARPFLNIAPSGSDTKLSWRSPLNALALEENSILNETGWSEVGVISDDGTNTSVIVPVHPGSRFYRLKAR